MKVFLSGLLVLGLALWPTRARARGDDKSSTPPAPVAVPGPAGGATPGATPVPKTPNATSRVSAPESKLEEEIEQLKELVQAQTREIEAQRDALRLQEERTAALESQFNATKTATLEATSAASAATSAATAASTAAAAVPVVAAKVDGVAAQSDDMGKKLASLEDKMKSFGPFNFSGDIRLRDEPFFGGPANNSQVRDRFRYRVRFNAKAQFNDDFGGGFSLSTGDVNNPISTNQTANQYYTRKAFLLDTAYLDYHPHYAKPLTLLGGKFIYPWVNTELVWDKDLNPEGLAQKLAFDVPTSFLKKISVVGFELPFAEVAGVSTNNSSIVQSIMYGGQVGTNWDVVSHVKFSAYVGYYNFHNADSIAKAVQTASLANPQSPNYGLLSLNNNGNTNSITTTKATSVVTVDGSPISTGITSINNAQFGSKFGILDTIARFDVDTGHERWPLALIGDFAQNTRACANVGNILPAPKNTSTTTFSQSTNAPCNPSQRQAYWLEARVGRLEKKHDLQLGYTRIFIEREAVLAPFNYSEIYQGTNVSEHRMDIWYQVYPKVTLDVIGLFGRPLVTANSAPPQYWLERMQFDLTYKF